MNVKTGDLAIIISTQNAGAIVEVLKFHGDYGRYKDCWVVKPTGKLIDTSRRNCGHEGLCRDAILRPVSGLPDEDVIEKEREHANQE